MNARYLSLAAALAVAACANQAAGPTSSSGATLYATDVNGKAASCTAPDVALAQGKDATGAISTGGGGWCGISVTMDGKPLTAGLLVQPAKSGRVYVHTVGDATRVDYTPTSPATSDSFAVQFIPGDETMRVTVTLTGAAAAPAAAPAPAAPTPAAKAPATHKPAVRK